MRHLVARDEIRARTLTFLMFTDYGMPQSFYNDHYDLLLGQDFLFARKISPEASALKQRLAALYADDLAEFKISNEGRSLFTFLTGQGRVGRRFAARFWETGSTLGRHRELMIVVCKKWHVAKRLLDGVRQVSNVPSVAYLFNEHSTPLPDLGGIEASLDKRMRHRRALLRMLFEYHDTNRMIICLDPGDLHLLKDFCADRSTSRLLEIRCAFSDSYLIGHARRVGLAGEHTSPETLERLLPTLRNQTTHESDKIQDAKFAHHYIIHEQSRAEDNAASIATFLNIPYEQALGVARTDHLFAD